MIHFDVTLHPDTQDAWSRLAAGHWTCGCSRLKLVPAAGYALLEGDDFLIVHDGRIDAWQSDPLAWNGSFLAVRFMPQGGLQLISDRLGTLPIYWASRNGITWLSSQLLHFARAGFTQPDRIACWQALFFQVPQWQRSYLENVALTPPASVLNTRPGQPVLAQSYWTPPSGKAVERSADQYLDELIERMRTAHARCLRDDDQLALPVTGGLDSRINLALQRSRWHDSSLFTGFARGELEAPIVGKIAAVVDRPMLTIQRREGLLRIVDSDVWSESGELNFAQRWLEDTVEQVARHYPGTVLVDGYMQDVLFNPIVPRADNQPLYAALDMARFYYGFMGNDPDDQLMKDLLGRFEAEYDLTGAASALEASQRHYLHNRSRRHVYGMVRLAQNKMPVAVPGVDNELLDFGFSLPWSMRVGSPLYRRAIATLAPVLAAVPYDKTGLPILAQGGKSWRVKASQHLSYYLDKFWPTRPFMNGSEIELGNMVRRYPAFKLQLSAVLKQSYWLGEMLRGPQHIDFLLQGLYDAKPLSGVVYGLLTIARLEAAIAADRIANPLVASR